MTTFDSLWNSIPDGSLHCDNIRDFIRVVNGRVITPPENKLDIFTKTKKIIPIWNTSTKGLRDYSELSKIYLDIETIKIPDGMKDIREIADAGRIVMVGLRNERGQNRIIRHDSERDILRETFDILNRKRPDILLSFRGVYFDLPYIHHRAETLGVKSPFWINYDWRESTLASANIAGRPWDAKFRQVFCTFGGKKCSHVDVYQMAITFDSVMRRFNSMTLKNLPIELELREQGRLDLGIDGIVECIDTGDWDTLKTYLEFDLEDTNLLGDFFMPGFYYQQVYFPDFNIQKLSYAGNATKWNSILRKHYGDTYTDNLPEPEQYKFQGALTYAIAGVHENVAGGDFGQQYPTCMGMYGVHSEYDPDMFMLAVMKQAGNYRESIKYKEDITQADKDLATAIKPVVNSAYGTLGSFTPFGDSIGAAIVTMYGRARLLWARKFVQEMGGVVVLQDTDSTFVKTDRTDIHLKHPLSKDTLAKLPPDAAPQLLSAVAIIEQLKLNIPEGAKLDLEAVIKVLFVPPSTVPSDYEKSYKFKSVTGKKYLKKLFGDSDEIVSYALHQFPDERVTFARLKEIDTKFNLGNFPDYESVKKNYIKIEWNTKKQKWNLKAKGRFVNRDRTVLERKFQQDYLELMAAQGLDAAKNLYSQTLMSIAGGDYNPENLTTTRTIRKNEITLVNLGFGKIWDKVSFYIGEDGTPVKSGKYNMSFYLKKLNRMYDELTCQSVVDADVLPEPELVRLFDN